MAKTLSSRESLTDIALIKDLVTALFEHMDVDEEQEPVADDPAALMEQLETAVLALMDENANLDMANMLMATDLLQLSVSNALLARDLATSVILLESLHVQPWDKDLMDQAMGTLRREGEAEIEMQIDDGSDTGLLLKESITFDEDKLREALQIAICEYNTSLSEGILTGKIKP